MRASTLAFVASALVGLSTQTTVSDLPFPIDISGVSISTFNAWCSGQLHVCDVLCNEDTKTNKCEEGPPPVWDCACSSNSSAPGAQYYSSSMQAQLCQLAFAQCQKTNAQDAQKQKKECEQGIRAQCGTLDIADADTGSDSEPTTTTATKAKATDSTPKETDSGDKKNDDKKDDDSGAAAVGALATGGMAVVMAALFSQLL